jgi:replication factor C large subunit
MGIGVSSAKHETYKKFTKIQTPTIFGIMSRNRGKRNLRDDIADKMFDKMHVSRRVAVSMFPYLEIMFQNDELAWEISDFLELEENEIKRFRKKKIPKKVINKMEKQKAQMRVEERDRRAEELKNQMMNAVPEVEEIQEDELPFENSGIEKIPKEETPEEPEVVEEPEIVEEEKVEEKKEKKADKQTTLFSF